MSKEPTTSVCASLGPSDLMALMLPMWVLDVEEARVVWANDAALSLWHLTSREELYARDMRPEMNDAFTRRMRHYQQSFLSSDQAFREIWTLYPERRAKDFNVHLQGHRLADGRMAILCVAMDQQLANEPSFKKAEALDHVPVCLTLFSDTGAPLYANIQARGIYGEATPPLAERLVEPEAFDQLMDQIADKSEAKATFQVRTSNGIRWHEIIAHSCHEESCGKDVVIVSEVDVTELREKEEKISYLAHHDILTGLHSRNYVNLIFPELIDAALSKSKRMALLLIDLDNFKTTNDTLGHLAGDALLLHVSKKILEVTAGEGHVARLGGDEFAILWPTVTSSDLDLLCERLLSSLSTECAIGDHLVFSKASIGVAICPNHGDDLDALLRHADLALYEAKDAGRNTHRYFRPALQRAATLKRLMEKDLDRAITNNEFRLFYQPRVDCSSQKVRSVEALMRWYHPEQGIIPPNIFIPTLEETGMIHEIGDWIVSQAGHDQITLKEHGFNVPISINISPKQFERPDFVGRLRNGLAQTSCPASKIEIEITESMLMGEGYDAKPILQDLRSAGFSIAIDDFGTGYSNLAYIQDYPISSLKVDRSFVQMIEDRTSVVNMILSLCRLVGITAVAEGVETIEQLLWLQTNHCNEYQGYLYSRPLPLSNLLNLLANPPESVSHLTYADLTDQEVAWAG